MTEPTLHERSHGSIRLARRQALARCIIRALGHLSVTGSGAVPPTGPVVLAINHRSLLDGPLVFGFVDRPVNCLVKAEAFTRPLTTLLRSAGQIPVVRATIDPAPMRLCLAILRAGGVIGVFPEGKRGDGLVRAAKPGVGYFALRSGATVVPTACTGTADMTHRRGIHRPSVRLTFGEPIHIRRHPDHLPLNKRVVAETTEQIRLALAALVDTADGHPPAYRKDWPHEHVR